MRPSSLARGAAAGVLIAGAAYLPIAATEGTGAAQRHGHGASTALFVDTFAGPDGLIVRPRAHGPVRGAEARRWTVTSGTLFRTHGRGWTGRPDSGRGRRRATGSAVFRMHTRRADFRNVRVSFRLRLLRLVTTRRTPAVAWDGVHVWLRYRNERWLYALSVDRRDGTVVIKKKCPGGPSNGGTYYALSRYVPHRAPARAWRRVSASAVNRPHGGVALAIRIDGRVVARARDTGVGCAPITSAGAVGIRGDNANFLVDDFVVRRARTP